MNSILTSLILLAALAALVLAGRAVQRRLPEHHLSADSKDAIKLAMGLVATMTALLLGLLVSSAKGTYDTQRSEVIQLAAKVTFLDRVLVSYGPEAAPARDAFRAAVQEAIRRMWPEGPAGRVDTQPKLGGGDVVYAAIQQLAPHNEMQRGLKAEAATLAVELGQLRMLLIAQMVPSIPKALLISVMIWLGIIFLGFSLLTPPNATTLLSLMAAAVSVAAAFFLIMELDRPLGGLIRISSDPMLIAASQLAP